MCAKGVQIATTAPLQFAASLAIGLGFLALVVFLFGCFFPAFALGDSFVT